ncbi:hypothetical protein B0H17DRAFT_61275 [Mycena rosella]|uniref:Uncharacterized protein n=1 Tax=Mycena rosella TaxID=1033263 RepID=A0AAD7D6S0_MYCRO|nr:hypothetical protein B0H17DRAFT_61275 [Mycena rosella]
MYSRTLLLTMLGPLIFSNDSDRTIFPLPVSINTYFLGSTSHQTIGGGMHSQGPSLARHTTRKSRQRQLSTGTNTMACGRIKQLRRRLTLLAQDVIKLRSRGLPLVPTLLMAAS